MYSEVSCHQIDFHCTCSMFIQLYCGQIMGSSYGNTDAETFSGVS